MEDKTIDWENMNNSSIKMELEELMHHQKIVKEKIINLSKKLEDIEKEYQKPREERNKGNMKRWSQEAKSLRKLFKECKEQVGTKCCPHCGEEVDL